MSTSLNIKLKKVLVIGLGQLGLPVAKYILDKGFDVYGYDINNETLIRAKKKIGIKTITNFKNFDIYIVCISTHNPSDIYSPQIDGLFSVINKISSEAKNGSLVSIESTIPQGTSKKVFELLEHRLHVVHAPHRWYSLDEKNYGVNQLRIIGGVNPCCLKLGLDFYNGNSECKARISNNGDILFNYNRLENDKVFVDNNQLNLIDASSSSHDTVID